MPLAPVEGRRGSDRGAGEKPKEIGEWTDDVVVRSSMVGVHVERLGSCVRWNKRSGCRVHDGEAVKDWC
eukprot:SAG11_NODE_14603_length_606_cov_0.909270_1_plen_68_part_01